MDQATTSFFDIAPSSIVIVVIIVIFLVMTAYLWRSNVKSLPIPSWSSEGFVSGLKNESAKEGIKCNPGTQTEDEKEFDLLKKKLTAFKKDLANPAAVLKDTLKLPFLTSQDMESVAETASRCFMKTISSRDLEISLEKWQGRGKELISSIAVNAKLGVKEVADLENSFETLLTSVKETARQTCLPSQPLISNAPGPRDPHPFDFHGLNGDQKNNIGEFTSYY